MSSLYGTTQAYNVMADTYIGLAPTCNDKLWGTDINYCDMVKWGIYDGQEDAPYVRELYLRQRNGCHGSLCKAKTNVHYDMQKSSSPTTVWSLIATHPQLTKWKKICEKAGWDAYLQEQNEITQVTAFCPTNDAISDEWMFYLTTLPNLSLRPLTMAHTLPFTFEQESARGRKLRLYTSLETFSVYIDGTGETSATFNFYIPKDTMLNFQYPTPLDRINIVQGYYLNNGAAYIIDGVFKPTNVI